MTTDSIFDAKVLLPGLKLVPSKGVEVPGEVQSLTNDGSILVFLKKFDGNLSLFRDQKILLEATYQSRGTPPTGDAGEVVGNVAVNNENTELDGDEEDPWDEEPWDEKLEDNFEDISYEGKLVEEWEWAKKRVDSPSIDGYESFLLKPEEVWKSADKSIEDIELCFFFTETDAMPSESLDPLANRAVEVGEKFVMDYPLSKRVLLLEWDFDCVLMKEVSSPLEREILKREREISDEILLLGMHGVHNFDPSESLVVHVHLNDYIDGGHENLKLKLYDGCDIEPDPKRGFDDIVDDCIKKASACDSVGSFSASDILEGECIKFEIRPRMLLQMLQALEGPEDDEVANRVDSIIEAIEAAQFAAVIEDENSGQLVAKFLLSSVASNNIYFDSAVQMIKSPQLRTPENIADWSMMVTRTAESIWDALFTHADYKLTKIDSVNLGTEEKALQEFKVQLAVPNIQMDVANIDPYNDIEILVENCDHGLSFVDLEENKKFLHIRNATRKTMSGGDHVIEFNWKAIDRLGVERECEMKVSFLVGIKESRQKKMGKTISIVKEIEGTSKQHISMVRLRDMVKMGLESASGIQCCFSHFLEQTFKMVFAFSTDTQPSESLSDFQGKAADDVASRFYKNIADRSEIYEIIRDSEVFSPRSFENLQEIDHFQVAEFLAKILGSLDTEGLRDWALSMKSDEDALRLAKNNESIDVLYEKHVSNLRRVIQMETAELASHAGKDRHQKVVRQFVDAAQLIRDEIDSPRIDLDEQLPSEELNTPESDLLQILSETSASEIEVQTEEILASLEEQIPSTIFSDEGVGSSQNLMENVSAMETNLIEMLETTADSCDASISFLDDSQQFLEDISTLLKKLRNFGKNIKNLSNNAKSLNSFVHRFWTALTTLSKIAIGPLAAIKTIVSAIKLPMQKILNALDKGAVKIKRLSKQVDKKLKALVTKKMIKKVDSAEKSIGKPKPALEKVVEIVDMLISVASMGLLPMSLISEFASSNSLESFFGTMSKNLGQVRATLDNVFSQTNKIEPQLNKLRDLSNSVASKFNLIRPLDASLKKLQPFVDKINNLYKKFSGWAKYLLEGAMWPVEQAINAILYPFRSQINRVVRKLNPFSAIDALLLPLIAPLRDVCDHNTLADQLNYVENIQSLTERQEFKQMANSLTLGVAIVQRGLYGLLQSLLIQGSDNVELFEGLLGGADSSEFKSLKSIMDEMKIESPVVTLGDTILNMKKFIDHPLAKCDSYLLMNASNNRYTFEDSFTTEKMTSYLKTSEYDLVHYAVDPSSDISSALFEYGAEYGSKKKSWMMASMASILHHGKLTKQAEQIGVLPPQSTIATTFIPVEKGNGRYSVSLYPKFSELKVFDVDSRLPLPKIDFPTLKPFEDFPTRVFDYANERIQAGILPIFSEKYSLALVEKVIGCELNMMGTESIGTAMHLLSGNISGYCYRRDSSGDDWLTYEGNKVARETDQYDTVGLTLTTDEKKPDKDLISRLKLRTMSKDQVELLDVLHRTSLNDSEKGIKAYDQSSLEEAMGDFSMFIVVTEAKIAYPILYSDNSPENNLVYADGSNIQPLFDLSNISEIWEYTIFSRPIRKTPVPDPVPVPVPDPAPNPAPDPAPSPPPANNSPKRWNLIRMIIDAIASIFGRGSKGIQAILAYVGSFFGIHRKSVEMKPRAMIAVPISPVAEDSEVSEMSNRIKPVVVRSAIEATEPGRLSEDGDPTITKFVDRLMAPIKHRRAKKIFRKAMNVTVRRISYAKMKDPRYITKGDYIKGRTRSLQGVVMNVKSEERKVGKGKKKVITGYEIRKHATLDPHLYFLPAKYAKKLTDEEKQNEFVLRNDKIFFGKGSSVQRLNQQADRRRIIQWTPFNENQTKQNVKNCGITFGDLKKYVKYCKNNYPYLWSKCIHRRGRNKFVSVDDLCHEFITPQTQGLRSSIALNMKNVLTKIEPVEVFVSLSWEEDIEQVIDLLEKQKEDKTKVGELGHDFGDDTVLWLSAFSIYQGAGSGSLSDQLGIDVFTEVTKSVSDMFVIRTGICNSYARLWCVSEFSAAIENEVKIHHIFSQDWMAKYTSSEHNGFKYAWEKIENNGEESLVYRKLLSDENKNEIVRKAGKIPVFHRSVNYYLMEEEEWGQAWGLGLGGVQPILRLNVQGGLHKGASMRNADEEEFHRLDNSVRGKYEFWWRMQKRIAELEREALGAKSDYKPYRTLAQGFTKSYEPDVGTNIDIIRRVQADDGTIRKKSEEKLNGFVPNILPNIDGLGRTFLEFQTDDQASVYFKEVLNLEAGWSPDDNVANLLSFGANNNLLGEDKENFSFPNIERLAKLLTCTYVDSMRLPPLASSYKLVPETVAHVAHPRNIFWAEYYQKAMVKAKTMIFVITAGWIGSKNCFEELGWAAKLRKNTDTMKYNTILVFSQEKHFKTLENKKTFTFKFGDETRTYDWDYLKQEIGFKLPIITATTVEEIKKKVTVL